MRDSAECLAADLPVLPPRSAEQSPIRGLMSILIQAVRIPNAERAIGRIKMWGESRANYLNIGQQLQYSIKCRQPNFLGYLRDAKVIRIEVLDRRNNQLIGWSDLPLLLHLPSSSSSSQEMLDISETIPVLKHPTKNKMGELQLRVTTKSVTEQPAPRGGLAVQHREKQALGEMITFAQQEVPVDKRNRLPYETQPEQLIIESQYARFRHQEPQPRGVKQRVRQPIAIESTSAVAQTIRQGSKDLDTELLRLRLEAENILSQQPSSSSVAPEALSIRLEKLTVLKCEEAVLQISYPSKQGGGTVWLREEYVCAANPKLRGDMVLPSKVIIIKAWRSLSNQLVKFQLEGKKGSPIKSTYDVPLCKLIQLHEIEFEVKGNKKAGKLFLTTNLVGSHPVTSEAVQIVPKPIPQPREAVYLIYLCVSNCELFPSSLQRNLYKVAAKIAGQLFESAPQPPTRPVNFDVICPIAGKLDEFLCLEFWKCSPTAALEAIGKISLEGVNLMLSHIQPETVGPTVVADTKVTLPTLVGDNVIGYLDVQICIGTPKQINWQRAQLSRQRMHQQPPLDQPYERRQTELTAQQQQTTERMNELRQSTEQKEKHQQVHIQQGVNLVETLTRFFQLLSNQPAKTTTLINTLSAQEYDRISQPAFSKLLMPFVDEGEQELLGILSAFFGEGSAAVDVGEFLKCFSSYANFIEILQEERAALLQRLLAELDRSGVALDVLEQRLLRHSQFGCLSKQKFKQILKQYGCRDRMADMLLGSELTVQIAGLVSDLKNIKFLRKPQHLPMRVATFQLLIKQSVEDVLVSVDEATAAAIRLQSNRTSMLMSVRFVAQYLALFKVEVSYWEALLLVETIKSSYKQDTNLPEGLIGSETISGWVEGVLDSHAASVKSADNSRLNKNLSQSEQSQQHIVVQDDRRNPTAARSDKEKSVTDEILNIADLLKFKDKLGDMTESEGKSKQIQHPAATQNQSRYSNFLPAESNLRGDSRPTDRVSLPERNFAETVKPLPIMRFLRCEVVEVKLSDVSDIVGNVVLDIQLLNSHQLLINCKEEPPLFYSSKVFYQEINMASIDSYARNGVAGLSIVLKEERGRTICRGLIPLETIFELNLQSAEPVKKTCLLYPRSSGRVVIALNLEKQRTPELGSPLQKVFLTVTRLQLRNTVGTILGYKAQVDQGPKQSIALRKAEQIEFRDYSSKLLIEIELDSIPLRAQVNLEGCIANDDLQLEVPVVDTREQFHGTLIGRLSRNELKQVPKNSIEPVDRNLHLFIGGLVALSGQFKGTKQLYFALYRKGRQVARTSNVTISLSGLSSTETSDLQLIAKGYQTDEILEVRTMTASDNLTYGVSRLSVALSSDQKLQFGNACYCLVENKDRLPMRISLSWVAIEENPKLKLSAIPRAFVGTNRKALALCVDSQALRQTLHDRAGYSHSEISYILANMSESSSKGLAVYEQGPTKEQAVQFAQEAEFSDPEHSGFVSSQQLQRLLTLFNRPHIDNDRLTDILTKQRMSVDYLRYLHHTSVLQRDSTMGEVCGEIDRVFRSISKKLASS